MKLYGYIRCGSCRKAERFLNDLGISFERIAIREQAPTTDELMQMLDLYDGNIKKLFNTSGVTYREQNIKEILPDLTPSEAIELLQSDGNLIKRPFLISDQVGIVGFKEDVWSKLLK
jgi:arsenate reductase